MPLAFASSGMTWQDDELAQHERLRRRDARRFAIVIAVTMTALGLAVLGLLASRGIPAPHP